MAKASEKENLPPKLRRTESGEIEASSLADLLEWFLMYDERTARMRHANTEELFQWKQQDDKVNGVAIYPFENAEARFALGAFQALAENNSEPLLKLWISDVLNALQQSHETKLELTESYGLDADLDASAIEKANHLTTNTERRLYLTSCWIEALCTAEVRFLGWVYQDIYGRPFS
ncbi:MAG: hypothetical protein ABR530_01725 [Pyrinomonadaceae bacterium]